MRQAIEDYYICQTQAAEPAAYRQETLALPGTLATRYGPAIRKNLNFLATHP